MTAVLARAAQPTPPALAVVAPSARRRWRILFVGVGVLGFAARLFLMLRGGGLLGVGGYDDGVYFAAADALVHGRLPYRDFLFLQPPGIVVATAPFALLGRLTSDPVGLAVGRLVFMAIGGLNAALVAAVLRRFGWRAAIVGGVFFAVFSPAVYAERSILLEPLGTLGILLALLLVQRAPLDRPRLYLLVGVVLGLTVGVKIWYVVPLLLITAAQRGGRSRMLIGASAGIVLIYLPFMVLAPVASLREIVLDQLGRPAISTSLVVRVETILGAGPIADLRTATVAMVFLAFAAAAVVVAACTRAARLFVVLLLADGLVLLAAPSFFPHYADLTAPPLALVVGVAVSRAAAVPHSTAARAAVLILVLGGIVAINQTHDRHAVGTAVPLAGLQAAAARSPGCITSDDPTILATMNVLSRDLASRHCAVWPDVSGWTYDADSVKVDGREVTRPENAVWQHAVLRYLESGSATIRIRTATGLSAESREAVARGRVLYRSGHFVLHATTGAPS